MMYVPDTEYGGIVREISTSTKADSITAKGYTWRGLMTKKSSNRNLDKIMLRYPEN